jgi:hypothetical protein
MKKTSPSSPTTSFAELADWQRLVTSPVGDDALKQLLRQRDFFRAPKHNDQIARQHSILLDKILGFDLKGLEEKLVKQGRMKLPDGSFEYWGPAIHDGAQTWVGLDAQTLNTPYSVLLRICELLDLKSETVIDLGAAHGRLGLVMGALYPSAHFIGFEYVSERVHEANRIYERWNCSNARCEVQDLFKKDFEMPEVDIYFIYDYGRHDHISATLGQISLEAAKRPIRLVARGQATNKLIADHHPWALLEYTGVGEEHFNIYRASPETQVAIAEELS